MKKKRSSEKGPVRRPLMWIKTNLDEYVIWSAKNPDEDDPTSAIHHSGSGEWNSFFLFMRGYGEITNEGNIVICKANGNFDFRNRHRMYSIEGAKSHMPVEQMMFGPFKITSYRIGRYKIITDKGEVFFIELARRPGSDIWDRFDIYATHGKKIQKIPINIDPTKLFYEEQKNDPPILFCKKGERLMMSMRPADNPRSNDPQDPRQKTVILFQSEGRVTSIQLMPKPKMPNWPRRPRYSED